jgi:hypothetical protein
MIPLRGMENNQHGIINSQVDHFRENFVSLPD